MFQEILLNHQELIAICQELSVKRLEIFGSALREDFDKQRSDIDFFYELKGNTNLLRRYLNLKSRLEKLFERKIDLIAEKHITNPFLKSSLANSPRKLVYEA